MILELAKCTAALAAVFLSGGVVYLMIIAKEDRRWLEAISYGWGAGIVLLYVVGGLMVRIPPLFFNWHLYYLGFVFLLAAVPVAVPRPQIWIVGPPASSGPSSGRALCPALRPVGGPHAGFPGISRAAASLDKPQSTRFRL